MTVLVNEYVTAHSQCAVTYWAARHLQGSPGSCAWLSAGCRCPLTWWCTGKSCGGSSTMDISAARAQFDTAHYVVRARRRAGVSQRELADAVGVARSTVGAVESGARQPSIGLLGAGPSRGRRTPAGRAGSGRARGPWLSGRCGQRPRRPSLSGPPGRDTSRPGSEGAPEIPEIRPASGQGVVPASVGCGRPRSGPAGPPHVSRAGVPTLGTSIPPDALVATPSSRASRAAWPAEPLTSATLETSECAIRGVGRPLIALSLP